MNVGHAIQAIDLQRCAGEILPTRLQMTGSQFLTDSKGKKTAAVIDLKTDKALWEDISDVLVSRSRSRERGIPVDRVKAYLIARGVLRG